MSEVLSIDPFWTPGSMGTPCLQTERAGFVISKYPEKGWLGVWTGCLGLWFFSHYCQRS